MDFSAAKEQIRQHIDIVDLVSGSIDLRRQGRGYVGLCPWHNDSRPSLQVNPDRQTWKCWVCDVGGDIFSFIMQREGIDFVEAIKMLAERAGVVLDPHAAKKRVEPGSPDDKNTLYAATAWAEKQFHEYFLRSELASAAREYVETRGLTAASVEKFKVGFSPNEWTWIMDRARNTPYTPAVLEACGLLGKSGTTGKYYDRFKGRVMFPIRDSQGRSIAFGGRILPQFAAENAAKYINSPETRLFSKSDQLYALDIARNAVTRSRRITVVEGYTDVVMCHQHGVDDVVAVLGTALNERHIQLLRRFADTIYLVLDGDEAGQRRTNDILEIFVAAQMDLRILTLPEEYDPDEFLQAHGGEQFRALVDQASDALEHKIRISTRGIDLVRDTFRASQALEDILDVIAGGLSKSSHDMFTLRSKQLAVRLAREFRLEPSDVQERMNQRRRTTKETPTRIASSPSWVNEDRVRRKDLPVLECELLEILIQHPELAPTALQELGTDELSHPFSQKVFRVYRELEESGETLEFGRVLAEIEDPATKSLLVELGEISDRKFEVANKSKTTSIDAATQLRGVLKLFHSAHSDRLRREKEAQLEQQLLPEREAEQLFMEMLAAKRREQGIALPKDG